MKSWASFSLAPNGQINFLLHFALIALPLSLIEHTLFSSPLPRGEWL
jgi:hypothetical protein